MNPESNVMCLTWDPQCRRIESLARELGASLHVVHVLKYRRPLLAPFKYPVMAVLTMRLLMSAKPRAIVVVVPPLPSALVAYAYCLMTGAALVIDAQTGAFSDPLWLWSRPVFRWLCRKALVTTVTNTELHQLLGSWKAPGMVLEDPIPVLAGEDQPDPSDKIRVVVVNSFANDEPVEETVEAAHQCEDCDFFITGRLANASKSLLGRAGKNVHFTDYLSESAYGSLLRTSDLVVVLCTLDNTMLCGAYEALSIGKPLLTSKWPAMERRFVKGTVFVENTVAGIRDGIRAAIARRAELSEEMRELQTAIAAQQKQDIERFRSLLSSRTENQASSSGSARNA